MKHITVTLDTVEFEAALLDLSAQLSNPLLEFVDSLIRSPQIFPKLFRIEVDCLATTGADNVRTVLQHTDLYLQLMATLRAIEGDGLVVPKTGHS